MSGVARLLSQVCERPPTEGAVDDERVVVHPGLKAQAGYRQQKEDVDVGEKSPVASAWSPLPPASAPANIQAIQLSEQ